MRFVAERILSNNPSITIYEKELKGCITWKEKKRNKYQLEQVSVKVCQRESLFRASTHLQFKLFLYCSICKLATWRRHLCVAIKTGTIRRARLRIPSPLATWTTPTNPTQARTINRTALKIAAQKEMQITTTDNKGNNNNNNRDDEMWAQNASKTIPIKL